MTVPEPLVAPETDLRGLPFMPLDLARLFDSDLYALSTGDEFKAAFSLWGKSFLQVPAGSLPDDDRVLAHLSGAGSRWKRVKAMALHGWILCSDGRFYHPVVCDKAREAWRGRLLQKSRAEKRWHGNAAAPSTAMPRHTHGNAAAMQGTVEVEVKKESVAHLESAPSGAAVPIISAFDATIAAHWPEQKRPWPAATDATCAQHWLDAGIDVPFIVETFKRVMAKMRAQGESPPRSLKYFRTIVPEDFGKVHRIPALAPMQKPQHPFTAAYAKRQAAAKRSQ